MIVQGNLGRNIKLLREEREMSQKRLSYESGVRQQELSNIERMVANPSVEVLTKIATVLDIPVCRLFDMPLVLKARAH